MTTLAKLYLFMAIGGWFLLLFFSDKLGAKSGWKKEGASVTAFYIYVAFLFWSAVVLGMWDRELFVVAAVASIPGLLGSYILLANFFDCLKSGKN